MQRMDHRDVGYKRSDWYDAAIDPNPSHRSNVTSSIIPDDHERLRMQLTPAYNRSSGLIRSLSESVGKHFTDKLEELTSQAGDKTTRVDLAHIIEVFSIQAFSNMAFGQVALAEVTWSYGVTDTTFSRISLILMLAASVARSSRAS